MPGKKVAKEGQARPKRFLTSSFVDADFKKTQSLLLSFSYIFFSFSLSLFETQWTLDFSSLAQTPILLQLYALFLQYLKMRVAFSLSLFPSITHTHTHTYTHTHTHTHRHILLQSAMPQYSFCVFVFVHVCPCGVWTERHSISWPTNCQQQKKQKKNTLKPLPLIDFWYWNHSLIVDFIFLKSFVLLIFDVILLKNLWAEMNFY